jgi:hypothetical protein
MKIEVHRTAYTLQVTLPSYVPIGGIRVRCLHVPLDLNLEEWHAFKREVDRELFAEKEESKS